MSRNFVVSAALLCAACSQEVSPSEEDLALEQQALNEAGDFKIGVRVVNYASPSDTRPTLGPIAENANWASRVSGREFTQWVAVPPATVARPTGIRLELLKNPTADGIFRLVDFRVGLQASDGGSTTGPIQFTEWASDIVDPTVPAGQIGEEQSSSALVTTNEAAPGDGSPSFFRAVLETRPFQKQRVLADFSIGASGYGLNVDNFNAGRCNDGLFGCFSHSAIQWTPSMTHGGGWSHTTAGPYDDSRCFNNEACRQLGQTLWLDVVYIDAP